MEEIPPFQAGWTKDRGFAAFLSGQEQKPLDFHSLELGGGRSDSPL